MGEPPSGAQTANWLGPVRSAADLTLHVGLGLLGLALDLILGGHALVLDVLYTLGRRALDRLSGLLRRLPELLPEVLGHLSRLLLQRLEVALQVGDSLLLLLRRRDQRR